MAGSLILYICNPDYSNVSERRTRSLKEVTRQGSREREMRFRARGLHPAALIFPDTDRSLYAPKLVAVAQNVRWSPRRIYRLLYYSVYAFIAPALGKRAIARVRRGIAKYGLPLAGISLFAPDKIDDNDVVMQIAVAAIADLFRGPNKSKWAKGRSPDVSIVIPIFNNIDFTLGCLATIAYLDSSYSFEVIVVDDNSTDDTRVLLSRLDWITYCRQNENRGFIHSCNEGLARATGEFVVFLNNDTTVSEGWLDELRGTFQLLPDAGLVGSKLIYPNGELQEAGGVVWPDGSAANYGRHSDPLDPRFNYLREVDYISGASIMLPTKLARELGGFDTYYAPAYYEDTDLAFRVRRAGLKVYYQPLSQVIHYEGATSGVDTGSSVKAYQEINRHKFFERWAKTLAEDKHFSGGVDRLRLRRRLLFLDETTPKPDQDAGSNACLATMQIVQQLGYQVTFIPADLLRQAGYTGDLERQGIEVSYTPFCASLEDHLLEYGRRYNAVLVHRVSLAWRAYRIVRELAPQARLLFMVADLHHLRERRRAGLYHDEHQLGAQAKSLEQQELAVVAEADCTLVHSEFEKSYLAGLMPRKQIENLGWISPAPKRETGFVARSDLMYIGGYGHPPNVDAVEYFVDAIWPKVSGKLPGVRFLIVGSNPPDAWQSRQWDGVELVGYAKDLDTYLEHCRLSVVPLRYGAGIKGKIVTSMAGGLPVVTTRIGAEGIGLEDGITALIADDPDEFAERVVALYTDTSLWYRLSENGMDFVAKRFSTEKGAEVMQRALGTP
jgi:GT2 family glycosyltransferase/glycosyltransferase involved in cell wall biosynthesis